MAGLIDGEGCIGITLTKGTYYSARLDVGMTQPALPLLNSLHSMFGGSVSPNRQATEKWAAAYRWSLSGKEVAPFLRCLAPHLRLKRDQALIAADCQEHPERGPQLKEEIHRLNAKGPRPLPEGTFAVLVGGRWVSTTPTLFEQSPTFSGTWPRSGSMRNGSVSQRPKSALPTSASGSGSWPTATAGDAKASGNSEAALADGWQGTLTDRAVRRWPTPQARDCKGAHSNRSTHQDLNASACSRQHPTTPTDGDDGSRPAVLHPPFVEALMGLPPGWTETRWPIDSTACTRWATESSRSLRRLLSSVSSVGQD